MNTSSSIFSTSISTLARGGTYLKSKLYVFSPAASSTKLALTMSMSMSGIVGLVGSILMLWFLHKKKRIKSFIRTLSSEKNFHTYLKSLAISDVLCVLISLPSVCLQFYIDVFEGDWGCKIARYLQIVFPSVTMNNLLIISIEKYFSTRKVPRPFFYSTVKKLVLLAWIVGVVFVLLPASTFTQIRYEYNETHYTLDCKYDKHYFPYRIIFISFITMQYIIPSFITLAISICLIKTVMATTKKSINVFKDNAIKKMLRAAQRRATVSVILLVLAFVIPYCFYFGQVFYTMATQDDIRYETDFLIRYSSAVLAYSNGAINFFIYLFSLRDFRSFLKEHLVFRFRTINPMSEEAETGHDSHPT